MKLRIITPEREMLSIEVEHAVLPGEKGLMDILPGHAMLVSQLHAGTITYFQNGLPKEFTISGGLAEVCGDKICILTN